jgi:hypothetical protein
MGTDDAATCRTVLCTLLLLTLSCDCLAADLDLAKTAVLEVNTSWVAARKIPQTLFGLFFEVMVFFFLVHPLTVALISIHRQCFVLPTPLIITSH